MNLSAPKTTLGIIGSGAMGRGIAQIAVLAGTTVILSDRDPAQAADAVAFIGQMLERAAGKGRLSREAAAEALGRLHVASGLPDLAGADVVVEAIVENLEIKRTLFAELESVVREDCILATNTSSLSVTSIARACRLPGRVAGLHFFNPVPLMKVAEVIAAAHTREEVVASLLSLVTQWGHRAVRAQDTPGFLVNHAGRAMLTEGQRIIQEAVTDFATVDAVLRDCAGFRMGPFELMDLTGLDVTFPALREIYHGFFQEPRLRPAPFVAQRFEAGLLGRKTGQGFYRYEDGRKILSPDTDTPAPAADAALWISPARPDLAESVRRRLSAAGVTVSAGAAPGPEDIIVVTPLGGDATGEAVAQGLPAERCVAVDAVFLSDARATLAVTPATTPQALRAAGAAFARTGAAVSVIRDSGGLIAQRVVAAIVNVACDIAQQGIASPADIDDAVRLGLGYPQGPLSLGDSVGATRILTILDTLLGETGDPRYRPSPWLRRRAALGLSLLRTGAV